VRRLDRKLLRGIAATTAATGALQALAPRLPLNALRAEDSAATRHLFGTVGMFMVCTGGLLLARPDDRAVALMTAGQKAGAAAAVFLGVRRGVFAAPAIGVASFDALSGLLALDHWRCLS
jgi:hypothetical protein